jgi:hypothetical protein
MQKILILFFTIIQLALNAQDTIYKRTGEVLSTKILEINLKDVSYKRHDLMDGPLFILNKTEIWKIKYFNGTIDFFDQVKEDKPVLIASQALPYSSTKEFNEIQLSYRRGKYIYQGRTISDRSVLFITENRNQALKSKELEYAIQQSRQNKVLQYTVGFGGAGLSAVSLMGCAIAADGGTTQNDQNIIAAVALASVGVFIASQVLSFNFKLKRIKYVNQAADVYNDNLLK